MSLVNEVKHCFKIVGLLIFLFISLVITLEGVSADECYYNNRPFFNNEMEMVCVFENITDGFSCITEVVKENNTIQVNPERKYVQGFGVIDKFESVGSKQGMVRVYFRKQNIYLGDEFEFRVMCNDGNTDFNFFVNVTPDFKDMYQTVYTAKKIKDNSMYFVGFILFAGLVIWFFMILKKRWWG